MIRDCEFMDQVIVINDGSNDGTKIIVEKFVSENKRFALINHEINQGKGAAIRTGINACSTEFIAIQDADLEYDPQELKKLLEPINLGIADVVYGSRFIGSEFKHVHLYWHSVANKCLTHLINFFGNLNLTDMEVCQKIFSKSLVGKITLKENRFGIEPELTAKLARAGAKFCEVGITYKGRTYSEGKKIRWRDGFRAIYCVILYSFIPKKFWLHK